MADTNTPEEQLDIAIKLNAAFERVARTLEKVEKSYETQADAAQRIVDSVNQMNTSKLSGQFESLSDSLDGLLDKVKEFAGTSKEIGDLGMQALSAEEDLNSMADQVSATNKAITSSVTAAAVGMSQYQSVTDEVVKQMDEMSDLTGSTAKKFTSLASKAAIGATALGGLVQGLKNVTALSRSVLGFTTSFIGAVGGIAASIIAIPFKIFTGLVDFAAQASGGMSELLQEIENVRKEFGDLKGPASSAVLETFRTMQNFSQTGLSTFRIFGTYAERLREVREVATAMGPTFGILADEFRANGGAILAYQKGLGIAKEEMKSMAQRAITMGKPLSKLLLDTTKQTLELGKAFGIDQKLIGRDISKATADVAHFGSVTVKEIGRASVYARKLGVELDKIVGIMDSFETFDTAAENAAKLSQSFGVTVDAFKLMEAQSPDEQIEMLRKQFSRANVDASQFNRQQLKLLTTTTGLDAATAKQVFSLKNQGSSLEDIKKKSEAAEKKQLTQAEAMSKLADSIERLVKSGATQSGGFFDQFVKGFFRGIQASKEFRQMIWFIKRDLQIAMFAGVKLGRAFVKAFPGVKDFLGGLRDFFQPGKFRKFFYGITAEFVQFFHELESGKASLPELFKRLQARFFNFFDSSTAQGQKLIGGFKKILMTITDVVSQAVPLIAKNLGKGLEFIGDFISGKKDYGAKKYAEGQLGFIGKLLQPLLKSLKDAYKNEQLRKGIASFTVAVGDLLKKVFASPTFKTVAKGVVVTLATTLFAPAVFQAALGAIGTSLLKKSLGSITSVITGGLGKGAVGKGTSKLLGTAGPIGALAAAGLAVGSGVNKYKDKITSTLDKSSIAISAGATGVVNSLTLGLLPPDLQVNIANAFAKLTDVFFSQMGNYLGKGFAGSIKRRLGATFELVGSVYDFFDQLFTGDQESFEKAAKELGFAFLRMGGTAAEFFAVQFPTLVGKIVVGAMRLLFKVVGKGVTTLGRVIAGTLDSIFGTDLKSRVTEASKKTDKLLDSFQESITSSLDKGSKKFSETNKKFMDSYLRSADDQAKAAKKAAQTVAGAQSDAVAEASKTAERSLSDTLADIKAAKEIKKELSASGTDFKQLIADLKSKFAGVDFKIFEGQQAQSLAATNENIKKVQETVENVSKIFHTIGEVPKNIKEATNAVKSKGFAPAIEAVHEMTKLANQLESALADGNLNKLDVKTKLANVAGKIGLGSKARYTIQNKPVNITLNLEVSMNAEDLERSLIMRTKSVIRNRINWLAENPRDTGGPSIPETPTKNFPNISKTGG